MDVVITVIAVILVIMLWIMLYDSNRFVVRHYSLRDQRIKKSVKAVVLADLHNKRYGKENERLLQAIDEIGPDMVLIAGDLLTAKPKATLGVNIRSIRLMALNTLVSFNRKIIFATNAGILVDIACGRITYRMVCRRSIPRL